MNKKIAIAIISIAVTIAAIFATIKVIPMIGQAAVKEKASTETFIPETSNQLVETNERSMQKKK